LVALLKKLGYGSGEKSAGRMAVEAGCALITTDLGGEGFMDFDRPLLYELRQEIPVDGLNVYHPAHSPARVKLFRDYAREHGLLTCCGSDSHGPERKPIPYPASLSRNLLERLGIRVG
jgi:hypothetical protein